MDSMDSITFWLICFQDVPIETKTGSQPKPAARFVDKNITHLEKSKEVLYKVMNQ